MSIKKPGPAEDLDVKVRTCLSCLHPFDSSWAGERICPKCKSSSGWRSGTRRFTATRPKR
jgi:hypothetical protein